MLTFLYPFNLLGEEFRFLVLILIAKRFFVIYAGLIYKADVDDCSE